MEMRKAVFPEHSTGRKDPVKEFGRFSPERFKPRFGEKAFALAYVGGNRALELAKDAVGLTLWYGIGLSLAAAEKVAELSGAKKRF